ncbi:hypothetical protein [Croceicoccus mobilis]|uniref:Uncharacterized protein n=1 Tax=Croceicoccus mobilis TaxID=1703339 RepID=A0A917DV23_9SPHN|nr:hypothetical protein [Croceicoccus mobilis]GGD73843.1 hypothetical protein GCM10010990_24330 [Croceicoccus mobilis]
MIDRLLADHSSNLLGKVRNKAQLSDIVRELFGENTGNASARELAQAWSDAAEMLRMRFNAAGGDIGRLERWGLPQAHDSQAVRKAGFDAWRAEILPRLDPERMIDKTTGQPFTPEALDGALREIFETIRSDGMNKVENPGAAGGKSMANQRGDARFFVFRSADDWMAYSEAFGAGNAFDAMMGHIDMLSRDIAMMEVLGPNPNATIDWVKGSIDKSAKIDQAPNSAAPEAAHKGAAVIDRLWRELKGENSRPESRKLALAFSSLRSLQTAAKLGGAFLSGFSDQAFSMTTRAFNGLSIASSVTDHMKLFRPGSKADQLAAVRLGLIADEWSSRTASQNRYLAEELTGEVSRRLAEGVLRVSGLSRWTQTGRWAFGMEYLGHVTAEAGKSWDNLHPAFRGSLERYGIDAAGWDAIRATPTVMEKGVPWIKPDTIADRELGDRLLEAVLTETDYAVPVPDLRTRAVMNSVAPKGTIPGELIRSAAQFKGFGVSIALMHGRRIMEAGGWKGAGYAAGLVGLSTVIGGISVLSKDIAAGRDPREVDGNFWLASMLQGGGLGIFGDFVNSANSRFGGGITQTLAGPMAQDVDGILNIAHSKKPAAKAVKEGSSLIPGQSLWYLSLAFDRMVADQLYEAADPDYRKSWKRMDRWADEQGTQYWWAPGDATPERAPDMGNITERNGR